MKFRCHTKDVASFFHGKYVKYEKHHIQSIEKSPD